MTILMIFFLMLFAHRLWAKKVSWEERSASAQLRAAQETQKGMLQRLSKLASSMCRRSGSISSCRTPSCSNPDTRICRESAQVLLAQISPDLNSF